MRAGLNDWIDARPFERDLEGKASDDVFLGDIAPLPAADVRYDADAAMRLVRETLCGEPWRGRPRRVE